jgi:tetratricopeptide (TPR) repeat protein
MIVEDMERRFFELKGKLDVGVVNEETFKSEVQKLRFQDKQGRWWMIGAQSGKWYSYDGLRWIPGQPPTEAVPTPVPPVPVAIEQPPQENTQTVAAPSGTVPSATNPSLSQTAPLLAPSVPASPPQPEHIKFASQPAHALARPPRSPIRGWVLIGGAALAALLAVIVLWIVVENVVPGKPISTFFAGMTGKSPAVSIVSLQTAAPKEVSAFLAQGDLFLSQSQIDVAVTQYQNAAQLVPTAPAPLVRWSRALAFKGMMQESLAKAQQAAQRSPNDPEVQAQLCRAFAWNGQVNDAITAGEKAVQLDPKNGNARANLTDAYLLAKRLVDAQAAANAALQIASSSADAHRAQAWVLTIQGQRDNALNEWKQTVALEPDFYFRHFEYGEVLRLYFNAPADAIPELQKAATLYGAYTPSINRLGLALIAANKPLESVPHFQRAITLDPNNADLYAYLGIAFGQANQCPQAIPYFEQALKLNPNNSTAQRGLADCKGGRPPTLPSVPPAPVPITPPTVTPK